MKQGIPSLLMVLTTALCWAEAQPSQPRPDLTQKPYEHLPVPDLGLKPLLLLTADGQTNPDHQRHKEMLEWASGEYDPERFDLEGVNGELRRMQTR